MAPASAGSSSFVNFNFPTSFAAPFVFAPNRIIALVEVVVVFPVFQPVLTAVRTFLLVLARSFGTILKMLK